MISVILSAIGGAGIGFFLTHGGIPMNNWHFWAIYGSAVLLYISGAILR